MNLKQIPHLLLYVLCLLIPQTTWSIEPSMGIEIQNLIDTSKTWNGEQIIYPMGSPQIKSMLVKMEPGAKTQNHLHQVPSFGYILEGEITVVSEAHEEKKFIQGDVVIELINKNHYGYNSGNKPVRFIVFYMGTDDLKNVVIQK